MWTGTWFQFRNWIAHVYPCVAYFAHSRGTPYGRKSLQLRIAPKAQKMVWPIPGLRRPGAHGIGWDDAHILCVIA